MTKDIDYASSGVDYQVLDKAKKYAQLCASKTAGNLELHGFSEVGASRGESAYIFDLGVFYGAVTIEGLGTKGRVLGNSVSEKHWRAIAQDTVATITNDLATVGATPLIVSPHWATGSSEWFSNESRTKALIEGWAEACNKVGATFAAGETSTLKDVVYPNSIELSGSGFGIINPKERLTLGEKLTAGDAIVLIESSGIHANGLTLVRKLLNEDSDMYNTLFPNGHTFGEAILTPTHLYSPLQQTLFESGIDIHYMVNVTGHGWRKLMRVNGPFTYRMHMVPPVPDEFSYIKKKSGLSDQEMYGTFNMGAGFAVMVSRKHVDQVRRLASLHGLNSWDAGKVEEGPKRVIIEPLNIEYSADSLNIR